jgi:hypothetical protein
LNNYHIVSFQRNAYFFQAEIHRNNSFKEEKMNTTLIIDGHVHIYPFYRIQDAVQTGIHNMLKLSGPEKSTLVWLLTERFDCDFFSWLLKTDELVVERTMEAGSVMVKDPDSKKVLYVCAGRQIVTQDNLEICALATTLKLNDRKFNTLETIRAVNDHGGVAALNWAPGKWFFNRGKIVENLIATLKPGELVIGDTSLRPDFWSTPGLMKRAALKGFKIIAGSDPLPFAGEETQIGRYGCVMNGDFDPDRPVDSIRKMLQNPNNIVSRRGRRNFAVTFFSRQLKIMNQKKRKAGQ